MTRVPVSLSSSRRLVLDVVLAVGLCAVGLVEVMGARLGEDVVEGPMALNIVTVLLTTLPLCVRRKQPLLVLLVVFGAVAGRALVSEPLEIYPPALAGLVAAYSVAAYAPFRQAVVGYLAAVASIAVAASHGTGGDATPDLLASAILLLTVWAIGLVVARRWSEVRHVAERAEDLHRRREEETRLAVEAERDRIARDLHDSVAHSLAMIAIQAGGAASVVDRDPQRAAASLRSIESTARTGLSEMRQLLHLVGTDDEQSRVPQPGLSQVADLVSGARRSGLDVALTTSGEESPVAPAVGLAAYRIVQESLTNAAKHAGGPTSVVLRWGQDDVAVEVTSTGRSSERTAGAGRGIVGMRERARVVGGQLECGPVAPDSFRVVAQLPKELPKEVVG
jgi:signal transduction histidine kinase